MKEKEEKSGKMDLIIRVLSGAAKGTVIVAGHCGEESMASEVIVSCIESGL